MSVSFITTKNGVITGYFNGDINCDLYGHAQYGHERVSIPDDVSPPVTGDPVEFYGEDWRRKSDVTLIDEGLLPMPAGYVRDGDDLRKMTAEERIIAGLDEPAPGTKVVEGEIVEMSLSEKVEAGLVEIPSGFRLADDQFVEMTLTEKVETGLVEVPPGFRLADDQFVEMTLTEKVEAGLVEVPPGFRLTDDQFVEMSTPEKFEAGVITEEEYRQFLAEQNQAELNRRLAQLSTEEAKAMAEIDSDYAAQRLSAMKTLLAVKQQEGWPITVNWPAE